MMKGMVMRKELYTFSEIYKKVSIEFDELLTSQLLNKVNQVYNTQVQDILFTALARTLKEVHGNDTSNIKLESYGRADLFPNVDIRRTVGWFTTMYPQEISINLVETKQLVRRIKDLGIDYDMKYGIHSEQLPEILFNYIGQVDNGKGEDWSVVSIDNLEPNHPIIDNDLLTITGGVFHRKLNFEFSGYIQDIEKIAQSFKKFLTLLVQGLCEYTRTYLTSDDLIFPLLQSDLDELQKDEEIEGIFAANSLQQGFIYQSFSNDSNDDAYICSYMFDYEQRIDPLLYKKAWEMAQKKYPTLRLALNSNYGELLQIIYKQKNLDFEFLNGVSTPEVVEEERKIPFDLSKGGLLRVKLIQHSVSSFTCLITVHHSILDGWSNPLLINFVNETYNSLFDKKNIIEEKDEAYLEAQNYLYEHRGQSDLFWDNQLQEVSHPDLNGLFIPERHTIKLEEVKRIEQPEDSIFKIGGETFKQLGQYSKENGLTLNIIAQYAWHKVLSVYGNTQDTTVGVINAGRNLPIKHIEQSVGLYITTLPVHFVHTEKSLLSQLNSLQDLNNDCMMHNNISPDKLQKDGGRLFDSLFVYENYPLPKAEAVSHKIWVSHFDSVEKLDYPLSIIISEGSEELQIRLKFAAEIFSSTAIQQIFSLWENIIEQIVNKSSALEYVKETPKFSISHYPQDTITSIFEEKVGKLPQNIALKFETKKYTFFELNSWANRVAHTLIEDFGVKHGDRVPLLLEKSDKMIIAILAILKIGAVYVPMSPQYPKNRQEYIKKQVLANLVIDEEFMEQDFSKKAENLSVRVSPKDLAYIIFTSGTTGTPKGVMVEHRNFIEYLKNILEAIRKNGTQDIEFGCIAEYVFDIFGTEIFGQLLRGKCINLFAGTPEEFPEFMRTHNVTTLQSTPGKIDYLFQDNVSEILLKSSLSTVMVGGEKMNSSFADKLKNINLINIYGPTEGTVWTAMKKVESNFSDIGTPFSNYFHLVLDKNHRILPKGAIGELYVGGPQLSRGYYGRKDLTEQAFIENPYNSSGLEEYQRIYKTGDIVRVLPNDDLELLGRNDFQVKIRGFRIELGEVESAVLKISGINRALALALGKEDSKYIGVYYQSSEEIKRESIEEAISQYLPDYMIPSGYQHVVEFPLTINGKIDRNKLPQIRYENYVEFKKPETEFERKVLNMVSGILGIEDKEISVLENFFRIGGDSIKVVKLISLIKQELNSKITVKEIFEAKTIRKIAEILEENNNKSKSTEGRLIVTKQEFLSVQDQKLSVGQKTYRQLPVNSYSNVKIAFRLKEGIDEKRLAKAIIRVVQHQEILRTKIFDNYQVVDDGNLAITHNNVNRSDYFAHRFDLTKEIPIKANIYEGIFTCVIDHVAFDGWSTSLFLSEIESAYFEKGLPNLPFQFKDFSKCQSEFLSSSKKSKQIEFWKEKLSEYMPIKFGDKKESKNKSVGGGDEYLHLDNHLYQRIIDITKEGEHTLHDILLGTFYLLLKKISGDEIVSIAIPTVNRSVEGTENLIGSFINQFLLPMRVSGDDTVELFLNRLSETVLAAQDNQDIPLETVIQELGIKLGGNSVYFGIQGFKGEALKNSQIFEPISEMNQQSVKDAFCDLTIFVWGQDINFNYNSREFSEERIEEIKRIYEDVLKKIVNNFDYKIKDIIRD